MKNRTDHINSSHFHSYMTNFITNKKLCNNINPSAFNTIQYNTVIALITRA